MGCRVHMSSFVPARPYDFTSKMRRKIKQKSAASQQMYSHDLTGHSLMIRAQFKVDPKAIKKIWLSITVKTFWLSFSTCSCWLLEYVLLQFAVFWGGVATFLSLFDSTQIRVQLRPTRIRLTLIGVAIPAHRCPQNYEGDLALFLHVSVWANLTAFWTCFDHCFVF